MGSGKLNIWISELGFPCKISSRMWYVNIYTCDGNILEWCGRRYAVIPAKCGRLEIAVPPGCYVVNAVWGYWIDKEGVKHGNHFTHNAVVQVCCEEKTCVTLFTPVNHVCGIIFRLAVRDMIMQRLLPNDVAQRFNAAMDEVLKYMPRPVNEFELGVLKELDELAKKKTPEEDKPEVQDKPEK